MVPTSFSCDRCQKVFCRKVHYDNHINRKFPCLKKDNDIKNIIEEQFQCDACHKTFTRNDTLIRHKLKFCHIPEPQEQPVQYMRCVRYNFLTPDEKLEMLKKGEQFAVPLLKKVYYNKDKPHFQTIAKAPNPKDYYVVESNYKWQIMNEKTLFYYLLDDLQSGLRGYLKELEHLLTPDEVENVTNLVNDIFHNDDTVCNRIIHELKKAIIIHSPDVNVNMAHIKEFQEDQERIARIKQQLQELEN